MITSCEGEGTTPQLSSPASNLVIKAESKRLRNLFEKFDVNRDGKIDAEELTEGLHSMGYAHISKEQIELFLKKSDKNRSGDLSLKEFVEYLQRHEKQLHFVFSTLDANKDGRITSSELKSAFNRLGISIGLEEAEKLVARLDDDNSLDISFDEWRDYLLFHPSSNLDDIIEFWRRESYLNQLDHGEDVGTPGDLSDHLFGGVWWRHFVSGGLAGAVSRTGTAPLDRIKVHLLGARGEAGDWHHGRPQVHGQGGRRQGTVAREWYKCDEDRP